MIVAMVTEKDRRAAPPPRHLGEKGEPGGASRGFERLLPCSCSRGNVDTLDFAWELPLFRKPPDECGVGARRLPAEAMIEMADNQLAVTAPEQPVQKHDRVATAGDADEVSTVVWQGGQALASPGVLHAGDGWDSITLDRIARCARLHNLREGGRGR